MRRRANPHLAPITQQAKNRDGCHDTKSRGLAVLNSPLLNKGTAFTAEERRTLGLTGLLPPDISTLQAQVKRAYIQYERLPDALSKNIYLTALHDRNEVLFYRLFSEHLREMIPIVNDLTVGMAMEQYHHECRRPRGVYLSIDHADGIEEAFASFGAGPGDIDLILATDAEQILGVGDWGVGGIEVSIGQAGNLHGRRRNRSDARDSSDARRRHQSRESPGGSRRTSEIGTLAYAGRTLRRIHRRLRQCRRQTLFPKALLQWEDFAPGNGRRILEKYRDRICTFNDDMQGTGAITLGRGDIGSARLRHAACATSASSSSEPARQESEWRTRSATRWCARASPRPMPRGDSGAWTGDGLLTTDMAGHVPDYQATYARPGGESKGWKSDGEGGAVSVWRKWFAA